MLINTGKTKSMLIIAGLNCRTDRIENTSEHKTQGLFFFKNTCLAYTKSDKLIEQIVYQLARIKHFIIECQNFAFYMFFSFCLYINWYRVKVVWRGAECRKGPVPIFSPFEIKYLFFLAYVIFMNGKFSLLYETSLVSLFCGESVNF